ncbi:MAG: AAA family ATPase [Gammaproteobacteria bacterium]
MSIPVQYKNDGTQLDGTNPLIILGPNGSGKTRYGLQISQWSNGENIAALRNIALEKDIPMKALGQATQELLNQKNRRSSRPWQISSEINNLFSKLMAEDSAAAVAFRDNYAQGAEPEITKLMKLQSSWHSLFPGREINFGGYSPMVSSEQAAEGNEYPAQSMSDGERVALYLAGRVLDANPGVIVVDEPEVHFHSRLAIQFWDELEKLRPDCRFVYITHDLTFAKSRNTQDFIVVRPQQEPDLISITDGIPSDIVEDILSAASFSIYASRIIFCEGTESSLDQKLLRAYYNGRSDAVIPVGSCKDVLKCVATFRENNFVEGVQAIGIIDADYWPQQFLDSIPVGSYVLPVHEIESLFCDKDLFICLSEHLGKTTEQSEVLYSEFLEEAAARFANGLLNKQISERFRCRCSEQVNLALNSLSVDGDEAQVRVNHQLALAPERWNISPGDIFDQEKEVIVAAKTAPFDTLLKTLPGKVYLGILVTKLGLNKESYVELICDALECGDGQSLLQLGQSLRQRLNQLLPND